MKIHHVAAAMILLATGALPASAAPDVVELTHEAVPSMITMPRAVDSELVFQACDTCKVLRLRASQNTQYFIGREQVTLAEMTRYLTQHPMAPLVLTQPYNEFALSRVKVSATARAK